MANCYEYGPHPPSSERYLSMSEEEKNLETEKAIARLKRVLLLAQYQDDTDHLKSP